MDYRRSYWALFLGSGLLFALLSYLDYLVVGTVTLRIGVSFLVALGIVGVTAYAAQHPERAGGPTEPNLRFAFAAGIFVLLAGLALLRLLG